MEFCRSVIEELLDDKAVSVRIKAIEVGGMRDWKCMLPILREMRSRERDDKVIRSLEYWMPMLDVGYRIDRSDGPGRFEVTVRAVNGIVSRTVEASTPTTHVYSLRLSNFATRRDDFTQTATSSIPRGGVDLEHSSPTFSRLTHSPPVNIPSASPVSIPDGFREPTGLRARFPSTGRFGDGSPRGTDTVRSHEVRWHAHKPARLAQVVP